MELVDIGANLGHESFDRDREQVLTRAHQAGVAQIVVTGASEPESATALGVARTAPGTLFSTAGVHPHHARDWHSGSAAALDIRRRLCALIGDDARGVTVLTCHGLAPLW